MVGVLIRMKLTILRRVATGSRANWMLTGGFFGAIAAVATIGVATIHGSDLSIVLDLLAAVLAIWALGWMLGPAWAGQPVLRAEHLALLPLPRHKLAIGLLGTAFVGITTAVTLVAFASTVAFAIRLGGVLPVIVSIPATVLPVVMVVLLSRLTARMFGALSRSRSGAAVAGTITALMLVVTSSGWIVFVAIDAVLTYGFSSTFSTVLRALPSSWGLIAVEAAAREDWVMTALPLAGLLVLVPLLVLAWSRLLGPPRLGRPAVRGTAGRPAPARLLLRGPTGAVYLKELRTWLRSPVRVQDLAVPPVFAVLSCLVPLAFDSTVLLPFAGVLTALIGAATSANLYGSDGTALWLTLVAPGTEEREVRGRQLAWLTLFGPLSIVLTIAGTVLSGRAELGMWAMAATVGVLGAAVSLIPLIGLSQLAPGPDPHRRKYSPMDHGDATGGAFIMLVAVSVLATPALAPLIIDAVFLDGNTEVQSLGVAVGSVMGLYYWTVLGRAAVRRLATRGPELLYLMRAGKEAQEEVSADASVLDAMPKAKQRLLWTSFFVGCIALFPQALVPMLMKLTGDIAKVWFLALYLPEPWQWPTIVLMIVLAIAAFGTTARTFRTEQLRLRQRRRSNEQEVAEPVPAGRG